MDNQAVIAVLMSKVQGAIQVIKVDCPPQLLDASIIQSPNSGGYQKRSAWKVNTDLKPELQHKNMSHA